MKIPALTLCCLFSVLPAVAEQDAVEALLKGALEGKQAGSANPSGEAGPKTPVPESASLSSGVIYSDAAPAHGLAQAVSSTSAEAQQAVLRGLSHLVTFWDDAAYQEFRHAIQLDPDCAMAHWGLVISTITPYDERTKEKEKSLAKLQTILDAGDVPEKELAYIKALYMLMKEGPRVAADNFMEISNKWKADQLSPLFAAMLVRDGYDAYGAAQAGQDKAIRILDQLIESQPELQPAYFLRALIEETAPVISQKASECAGKAVELAPANASSYHLRGHLFFRSGLYEKAEADFTRAAELYQTWQTESHLTLTDNEGYFRSQMYLAVSQFCRGDMESALKTADALAAWPVNTERLKAKGTTIQLWEARVLPIKLRESTTAVPSKKDIEAIMPKPVEIKEPLLSNSSLAVCLQYASARLASIAKDTRAIGMHVEALDQLQEMIEGSRLDAEERVSVSYWARCIELCSQYFYLSNSLLYPSSTEMWFDNAIETQRFSSMLLPPILPFPTEWKKAVWLLGRNRNGDCIKACDAGLARFPNHALILATKKKAEEKLKTTASPANTK